MLGSLVIRWVAWEELRIADHGSTDKFGATIRPECRQTSAQNAPLHTRMMTKVKSHRFQAELVRAGMSNAITVAAISSPGEGTGAGSGVSTSPEKACAPASRCGAQVISGI